jgi:hypothetical protein
MLQYRFTAYWVVASYVSLVVGKEPFALVSQTLQHLENFLKLWKMKPQLHDNIYIYIRICSNKNNNNKKWRKNFLHIGDSINII